MKCCGPLVCGLFGRLERLAIAPKLVPPWNGAHELRFKASVSLVNGDPTYGLSRPSWTTTSRRVLAGTAKPVGGYAPTRLDRLRAASGTPIQSAWPRAVVLLLLPIQFAAYSVALLQLDPVWNYLGYGFEPPGILPVGLSIGVLLIVGMTLPISVLKPSDVLLWILVVFLITPTLAVLCVNPLLASDTRFAFAALSTVSYFILWALTRGTPYRLPRPPTPKPGKFIRRLLVIALAVSAVGLLAFGQRGFDFDFSDVYSRRLELRGVQSPIPGAGYVYSLIGTVMAPALLAAGLTWKRWSLVFVSSAVAILNFGIGGERFVLFNLLFIWVIWLSIRLGERASRWPGLGMYLTAIVTLPVLWMALSGNSSAMFNITRRIGLVPAVLSNYYVDYANHNGFTWFTHTFMKFASTGEVQRVSYEIGESLRPGTGLSANTGVIADGYVSLGVAGVVLVVVALSMIVRGVDHLVRGRPAEFAVPVVAVTLFGLLDRPLTTVLVSGGCLVAILLVFLSPRVAWKSGGHQGSSHSKSTLGDFGAQRSIEEATPSKATRSRQRAVRDTLV